MKSWNNLIIVKKQSLGEKVEINDNFSEKIDIFANYQ